MLNVNNLIRAINHLTESDPLLSRGIERDWVCVINPALVTPIKELEKSLTLFPTGDLSRITGRETWIFNSAPRTQVQYMSRETMLATYAEEMLAEARLAEMLKEHTEDDASASGESEGGE